MLVILVTNMRSDRKLDVHLRVFQLTWNFGSRSKIGIDEYLISTFYQFSCWSFNVKFLFCRTAIYTVIRCRPLPGHKPVSYLFFGILFQPDMWQCQSPSNSDVLKIIIPNPNLRQTKYLINSKLLWAPLRQTIYLIKVLLRWANPNWSELVFLLS